MSGNLDVYIHTSGVVELRARRQLPPGERSFIELVPDDTPLMQWLTDPAPLAPRHKERRWSQQHPEIHGVHIWMEG